MGGFVGKNVLEFHILKKNHGIYKTNEDIPYVTFVERVNGNDFRRHYVVDFKTLSDNQIEFILSNFSLFQKHLMAEPYFYQPCPLFLHFLNFPKDKNSYPILSDKDYAVKTINDKVLSLDRDRTVTEHISSYTWNGQSYPIKNLNLIFGYNATGKSRLINSYAKDIGVPVFSPVRSLESLEYLYDSSSRIQNLDKIVAYCNKKNMPILLDDIFWGSFDARNIVYIIDRLCDSSFSNQVMFTSCMGNIKGLVLKRSYNPNIIDLNHK